MAKPLSASQALQLANKPVVKPPPPLYATPPDAVVGNADAGGQFAAPSNAGTGNGGDGAGASDIDWAKVYFGQYNLPSDLISQIESLGKQYGTTNPDVFLNSALNAVRGSDWFSTTFPGFAAGVRAGLFTDETGYRGYVDQLNTVYQQYLGRHVSGDETAAALTQGATPGLIGNQFQGDTIAKTNANQWQYLTGAFDENGALTSAEQTAYGREQAGVDTPLGQMVQKRVQQALARAQTMFSGSVAPASLSTAQGRLLSPSLGGGNAPDIGA